ncbi:hypothetical protein WICPIJ_008705 [Wickerhamomyces pijperi]|uniref:Kinesin motor domain-containing protein n=1 Tax=Wickerhamomyces pijperi TaxID=599730 RepID=A0A9P8PVC9_WICPI|nr:hypothetical protein WICPIJ_008705 [Wickerhamomyces pijperi]
MNHETFIEHLQTSPGSPNSRRLSMIPRPITPTKTESVISKEGYFKKSITPPSPLRFRSPQPVSPTRFLNTRSYDKDDLERLKSQIRNKEVQLQEIKSDILEYRTKIQQLEVEKVECDERVASSAHSVRLKEGQLENKMLELEHIKDDYARDVELKIKELRVTNETTFRETERSYRDEMEEILSTKVSVIQRNKTALMEKLKLLNQRISNNEECFQEDLTQLEESYNVKEQEFKTSLEETRHFLVESLADLDQQRSQFKRELDELTKAYEDKLNLKADLLKKLQEDKSSKVEEDNLIFKLRETIENLKNKIGTYDEKISSLQKNTQFKLSKISKIEEGFLNEETIRRKFHNRLQELKGNIRVFCRVRPPLNTEPFAVIDIQVPDNDEEEQQITIKDPKIVTNGNPTSSTNSSSKCHNFKFDRVFEMNSTNCEIFEEISQLVQSALDGFNICVFAYGQTGSGKTYTMSDRDGMIPRAVEQIFETSSRLSEKGWEYKIHGQFLEIYNESINDLLNDKPNKGQYKYEIRHDPDTLQTSVTDLMSVEISNPQMMNGLLERALKNRSIASTKANERSSRSHSVYIIKIQGVNHQTGERNHGILNLIDLAGSERLNHSQATGDRLKETQAINKSLSCLGDVIYSLAEKSKHIPFRNSKLTYLLQNSLNGNSKTLMFVNISPCVPHFNETLNSLRFATKVNNTKFKALKRNVETPVRS